MGIFASVVMGVFLYVGSRFLLTTMVTGTSTGEGVILNILPIILAAVVVGITINFFR